MTRQWRRDGDGGIAQRAKRGCREVNVLPKHGRERTKGPSTGQSAVVLAAILSLLLLGGCRQAPTSSRSGALPAGLSDSATAGVVATSTADSTQDARPSEAEIAAAVKSMVAIHSANVSVATVEDVKAARDARGRWWVSATAVPAERAHLEPVTVFLYRDGARWVFVDLGTGIDVNELPAEVRGALR